MTDNLEERKLETYFAPSEKTDPKTLNAEIDFISKNAVISGLLHSISGLLAVLDEHRQIIAVNDSFLKMLGINDPALALGLRPGEALECMHAKEPPHGCGTTKYCATCGAAIAIVASLGKDKPIERTCALSIQKNGKTKDLALLVKSQPIKLGDKRFILLFLKDISQEQHFASLQKVFFHDVDNMLNVLVRSSERMKEDLSPELAETIYQISVRLQKEVAIQRCLTENKLTTYQPLWSKVSSDQIIKQLETFFANHPAKQTKIIEFYHPKSIRFTSDSSLLLRILCNMLTNALEATERNGTVKFWVEQEKEDLLFSVWNKQRIPARVGLRIFQRNFTTKSEIGRGVGTYSMKLFGETILGGRVSFTSSEDEGTVFFFKHPLHAEQPVTSPG